MPPKTCLGKMNIELAAAPFLINVLLLIFLKELFFFFMFVKLKSNTKLKKLKANTQISRNQIRTFPFVLTTEGRSDVIGSF